MNKLDFAVEEFNNSHFDNAEEIALNMLSQDKDSKEAIDVLAAIYLKTKHLNFLNSNLKNKLDYIRQIAMFLSKLKMYEQAIFFYQEALKLAPNDEVGYNNLGLLYEETEETLKACKSYEKSIAIRNNYPAQYNLGVLYRKLNDLDKSEFHLKKALQLNPTNKYANYSLGMTYLKNKNFEKGYPYFLKRPIIGKENFKNLWDGQKHSDKKLLVFSEYGLGDAIMFSRYLPFLKEYFEKVMVCVPSSLIKLFEKSYSDIEFVKTIENLEYDYHCFMLDLPYHLKMNFDNIPSSNGYLTYDENKYQEYKEKFFDTDLKKVGIFYIGGELEKRNAKYRAIPLVELKKLFELKNCKFYSFQKDDPYDELKDFPELVDLGSTFNDFTDTAAALKNLDILISVDSSPIHLAGALNIKSLLMLPYYSEWRWFNDIKNTSWYDSVEIVKQTNPCDWKSVVQRVYQYIK